MEVVNLVVVGCGQVGEKSALLLLDQDGARTSTVAIGNVVVSDNSTTLSDGLQGPAGNKKNRQIEQTAKEKWMGDASKRTWQSHRFRRHRCSGQHHAAEEATAEVKKVLSRLVRGQMAEFGVDDQRTETARMEF
jgi:homoserine dehydrogenase